MDDLAEVACSAASPIGGSNIDDLLTEAEALLDGGRLDEAESLCRSIGLECAPAVYACGTLALRSGDASAAATLFRAAELLAPTVAAFSVGSARALLDLKDAAAALERARVALGLDPSLTVAHRLAAEAAASLGHHAQAARHLICVTEEMPDDANAWNALGLARMRVGELETAVEAFRRAIELCPTFSAAHTNLGVTLETHGRAAEGLRARQRARELTPEAPDVNSAYLFALNTSNATLEEIADEHRRWGSEFVRITGGAPTPHDHVKDPARRLRVGYVSADLREHAVAFFMAPILAHHDASVVEVYCYVNQHRSDHTSSQLRRYAHHWTSLSDSSDEAAAERIGNDGIDILVDLSGYTAGGRLGVFARQAAPIQVTYLGYPNTTGLPTMQYRITDRWADPPGRTEHLHSELLLRLPHSFLCYAPPSDSPAVAERSSAERGAVTFGSFNRGRKLSESTISLWSRILVALPEARILLKPGPIDRAELRDRFARQGVAADRIDLLDYSPGIPGHLDAYRAVDIALDSFPYNGTTTTCEALWMGVPVITLAGPDHRSRVGASLLRNVGLPEFIAESGDAYVECAQQLAQDAQRLRTLRASLRERMLRSALMDGKRFTQDLEAAYRTIWTEWCSETGRR